MMVRWFRLSQYFREASRRAFGAIWKAGVTEADRRLRRVGLDRPAFDLDPRSHTREQGWRRRIAHRHGYRARHRLRACEQLFEELGAMLVRRS